MIRRPSAACQVLRDSLTIVENLPRRSRLSGDNGTASMYPAQGAARAFSLHSSILHPPSLEGFHLAGMHIEDVSPLVSELCTSALAGHNLGKRIGVGALRG